ncbi:hypothetical protein Anapl_09730 [Anas platyrhynchos]|uniref:Uncharacterized protein n=1 Tax=Anas platyrhynchos TaxID=8839 RepID=R0K3R3_ANAPL|nr:hypothetical protein Anapl_09730 [Anas platyrhynchos]
MQGSRRAAAHEARRRDERRVSGQSSEHKGLAPAAEGAAACSYGSDLPVLRAAQGKEVPQHDPMDPKRQINHSRQAAPLPLLQHSPWRAQRHHEQDHSTSGSLLVQIYGVLSTGKARNGVFWGEEEPWGRRNGAAAGAGLLAAPRTSLQSRAALCKPGESNGPVPASWAGDVPSWVTAAQSHHRQPQARAVTWVSPRGCSSPVSLPTETCPGSTGPRNPRFSSSDPPGTSPDGSPGSGCTSKSQAHRRPPHKLLCA